MSNRYRVVILEDEKHNTEELSRLINAEADLKIIAVAEDGIEAETLCKTELPDILFADIDVPLKNGMKVAETASKLGICCIFSTRVTRYALDAFKIGAAGYLTKPYSPEEFHRVIETARCLLKGAAASEEVELHSGLLSILHDSYNFTPAELEAANAVAGGCLREELSVQLSKSERAVKSLLQNIYRKTVNNSPGTRNVGRSDKYARLVYFLNKLDRKAVKK